ncbi:MAG: DNA polymerase III subunit beta [Bdellovibrionales bacterium]
MKISLERAALLKTLGHVQSVVERRNTIPILSNILIRAQGSTVTVTATDMDVEMNETIAATVGKPGEITVSAHMLYDIVRKLPDDAKVDIERGDNSTQVTLKAGKSNFKLGTLPVEDFPQMREDALAVRFQIPATALRSMIDRTKFAISTEETRYYLNGIYLHVTKSNGRDVLRAVATDGHRLARAECEAPKGTAEMPSVIIPRKTVQELRKLLDETDDSIVVELSATKIRATSGMVTLTSKLIDGTYPDYERVIPTGNDKVATCSTRQFASAVDRVATISTEKSRAVKLTVSKGQLVLTAQSPEAGSATDELDVDYNDSKIEIGFNAKYLLDVAQQISGETTRIVLADAGAPALIEDTSDQSALYVLMPMRV